MELIRRDESNGHLSLSGVEWRGSGRGGELEECLERVKGGGKRRLRESRGVKPFRGKAEVSKQGEYSCEE